MSLQRRCPGPLHPLQVTEQFSRGPRGARASLSPRLQPLPVLIFAPKSRAAPQAGSAEEGRKSLRDLCMAEMGRRVPCISLSLVPLGWLGSLLC